MKKAEDLEHEVHHLNSINSQITSEKDKVYYELDDYSAQRNELLKKVNELEKEMTKLTSMNEQLSTDNKDVYEELDDAVLQRNEFSAKTSSLQAEIKRLHVVNEQLSEEKRNIYDELVREKASCRKAKSKCDDFEEILTSIQHENITVQRNYDEKLKELEDIKRKSNDLADMYENEADSNKINKDIVTTQKAQIVDLKGQLDDQSSAVSVQKTVIDGMKKESKINLRKIKSMENTIKQLQEQYLDMSTNFQNSQDREEYLREELRKKLKDIEELASDYHKLVELNKDLDKSISETLSPDEVTKLQDEIQTLQDLNKTSQKSLVLSQNLEKSLKASVSTLEKENTRLQAERDAFLKAKEDLEDRIQNAKVTETDNAKIYEKLAKELSELKFVNAELEKEVRQSCEKQNEMNIELAKMKDNKDHFERLAKETAGKLKNVETDLITHSKKSARLQTEIEKERHQKKGLENELNFFKQKLGQTDSCKDELDELLSQKDKEIRELQMMEESALESNAQLEQQLMEATMEIRKLEAIYEETAKQLADARGKTEEASKKLQELETVNQNITEDKETLQRRVKRITSDITGKEHLIAKLGEEIKVVHQSRSEAEELRNRMESEIDSMRKDKEEALKRLQTIMSTHVTKDSIDQKDKVLANQIHINEDLTNEVKKQRDYIEDIKNECDNLRQTLEKDRNDAAKTREGLMGDIDKYASKINLMAEEITASKKAQGKLERERATSSKDLAQVKKELDDVKVENNCLRKNCDDQQSKITREQQKISELEKALKAEKLNADDLEEEISQLKRQLTSLQTLSQTGKESRAELQKELKKANDDLEAANRRSSDVQAKLNDAYTTISKLEVEKALKDDLEEELHLLKQKLMKSNSDLEVALGEKEDLKNVVNARGKKVAELEVQLKNAVDSSCKLKQLVKDSEEEYISKYAYDKTRNDLTDAYQEISNLQEENEQLTSQLKSIEVERDSISEDKNKIHEILELSQHEVNTAKSQLIQVRSEFDKSNRSIAEYKQNIEKQDEFVIKLQKELKEVKQVNTTLQSSIDELTQVNSSLDNEVKEWSGKSSRLRKQLEDLQSENMALHQGTVEVGRENASLKNAANRLERKCSSLEKEIARISALLENGEQQIKGLKQKLSDFKADKIHLELSLEETTKEKLDLSQSNIDVFEELEEVKGELKRVTDEKSLLQEQLNEVSDKNENLEKVLKENDTKIAQMQKTISAVKVDERKQRDKLDETLQKLKEEQSKSAVLKNDHIEMKANFDIQHEEQARVSRELESEKQRVREAELVQKELKEVLKENSDELNRKKQLVKELEDVKIVNAKEKDKMQSEISSLKGSMNALSNALERNQQQKDLLVKDLTENRRQLNKVEFASAQSNEVLSKKIEAAEKSLSEMQSKYKTIQDSYDRVCKEYENLKAANSDEKRKVNNLERDKEKLSEEVTKLTTVSRKMEETIDSLSDELQQKALKAGQHNTTLEEKNDLILSLQGKLTSLLKKADHLEQEVRNSREETIKSTKEKAEVKNELQRQDKKLADSQLVITELNESIMSYQEKIARLEKTAVGLQTDKVLFRQERDEAKIDLDDTNSQLQNLKKDYRDKIHEFDKLYKNIENKQKHILSLEATVKSQDSKRKELDKKIKLFEEEKLDLKASLINMQEEYNSIKRQFEMLEREAKAEKEDKEKVIENYLFCTSSIDSLEEEKRLLKSENDKLMNLVTATESRLDCSEQERRKSEQLAEDIRRKLVKQEREYQLSVNDSERLKSENNNLVKKLDELQQKTLSKVTSQHSEVIRLKAELDYMKEELDRGNKTQHPDQIRASLEKEFKTREEKYTKEITALKEKVAVSQKNESAAKSEIKLSRNKLTAYVKDRENWEEKVKSVVAEIEREKAKNDLRDKEIKSLQIKLQKEKEYYAKKVNNLEQELDSAKVLYKQQIDSQKLSHSVEIDTRKVEIDGLRRQLSLQNSEVQSNRLEWEELRSQLQKKNKEIQDVRHEYDSLRKRHDIETTALRTDLQCGKIEQQLTLHRNAVGGMEQSKDHVGKIKELADFLQKLKKDSERAKSELKRNFNVEI